MRLFGKYTTILLMAIMAVLMISFCFDKTAVEPEFDDVTEPQIFEPVGPRGLCDVPGYPLLYTVNREWTNVTRGKVYHNPSNQYIGDWWDPVGDSLLQDGWEIIANHQGQSLDNVCGGFFMQNGVVQIDGGRIYDYDGTWEGNEGFGDYRFVLDTGIPPNVHLNIAHVVQIDSTQ